MTARGHRRAVRARCTFNAAGTGSRTDALEDEADEKAALAVAQHDDQHSGEEDRADDKPSEAPNGVAADRGEQEEGRK